MEFSVTPEQRRLNAGVVISIRLFRWELPRFERISSLYIVKVVCGPVLISVSY